MKFQILDVGHGFCALLVADNDNVMLFDCGHKSDPEFRPSTHLQQMACSGIERFFVTNYDEDHLSDLPRLRELFPIGILHRNRSITTSQLRQLKEKSGPLSDAMNSFLAMIDYYTGDVPQPPPEFPDIEYDTFNNDFGTDFDDTNNISLVTFLDCRGTRVLLPGDLETAGWEKLLQKDSFRQKLSGVNLFVASHHGRENGYCAEVFKYCQPNVVIFSDGPKMYATQEMTNTYASHASGIPWKGQTRKVLTTRNDGTLSWTF